MDILATLDQLKNYIDEQIELEESDPNFDWIAARDSAFQWIERLDDEGVNPSSSVFLFLEETLLRRDKTFGDIRRAQIRSAIESGIAFPTLMKD